MRKILFSVILIFTFAQFSFSKNDKPEFSEILIPQELVKNANVVVRQNEVNFEYKSAEKATLTEKKNIHHLE